MPFFRSVCAPIFLIYTGTKLNLFHCGCDIGADNISGCATMVCRLRRSHAKAQNTGSHTDRDESGDILIYSGCSSPSALPLSLHSHARFPLLLASNPRSLTSWCECLFHSSWCIAIDFQLQSAQQTHFGTNSVQALIHKAHKHLWVLALEISYTNKFAA